MSSHRRQPVRRLGRYLVNSLLVVSVLAGLAYLAPSLLGYQRYVITGGSMSGTVEVGDMVFAREVPVGGLEVGDVITYLPPADSGTSSLVTHRIIAMRTQEDGSVVMRTQGDANPDPDPWKFTLEDESQAVMAFSVPKVGHLFLALADPQLRKLLIGVPAGLIALLAAADLVRALRRHDGQSPIAVPA
jgi:signal peptidase